MPEPCRCGLPEMWTADPDFPVEFDKKMNEYNIIHGSRNTAKTRMRFCCWCGGELPKSKRDSFFSKPDPAEAAQVREIMAQVKSTDDMLRVLGEPDIVFPQTANEEVLKLSQVYSIQIPKTQFTYEKRWHSLSLDVVENADGTISFTFGGKEIDPSDEKASSV